MVGSDNDDRCQSLDVPLLCSSVALLKAMGEKFTAIFSFRPSNLVEQMAGFAAHALQDRDLGFRGGWRLLFEQLQGGGDHVAGGGVLAAGDLFTDEFFEFGGEGNFHGLTSGGAMGVGGVKCGVL